MDTERLTHASVCLDIALEKAENRDYEGVREYIQRCLESLEMVE
jgi:hypothetical protein